MANAKKASRRTLVSWVPSSLAIVTIGLVESYALSKGINGVALTSSIAAIAGIAGFKLRDVFSKGPSK